MMSTRAKNRERIDIKDLFDMTVGISTSSLEAVGLSFKAPEHSTGTSKPRFSSDEFI